MAPDDAGCVGDPAGGSRIPETGSPPEDKGEDETKKPKGRPDGKIARMYYVDPETVRLFDNIRLATSKQCPDIFSDAIRLYARFHIATNGHFIREMVSERDPEKIRMMLSEVGSQRPPKEAGTGPSETCGTSEAESPSDGPERAFTRRAPIGRDPWVYETCRECKQVTVCHRRPLRWGGSYYICEQCEGRLP